MANLSHIDMTDVEAAEESGGFELLPEGEYLAQVTDSSLIPTQGTFRNKDGKDQPNGHMLELTWKILAGPQAGRLIWDKIVMIHVRENAEKIGKQRWKKACRAAGISFAPQDSSEIHNKPVLITVETAPASNGYKERRVVKGYRAAPANQQAAPMAGEPQAGMVAQDSAPPWGGQAGKVPFG